MVNNMVNNMVNTIVNIVSNIVSNIVKTVRLRQACPLTGRAPGHASIIVCSGAAFPPLPCLLRAIGQSGFRSSGLGPWDFHSLGASMASSQFLIYI